MLGLPSHLGHPRTGQDPGGSLGPAPQAGEKGREEEREGRGQGTEEGWEMRERRGKEGGRERERKGHS